MLKNKGLIVVFLTALIAVAAFTGVGISIAGRSSQAFAGDGYVLSSEAAGEEGNAGDDGETAPGQLYFAAGTKYKNRYPESTVFKDIQGSRQTIASQSFLHYADDSLSALTDGVIVNMDDVNTGIANHYGVKAGVVMAKDASGYSVENNGNAISFTNYMWKLSDTRFLVASDGMTLTLPNGDTKTISGALEAEYIEDGIVCLMDPENKWQVVSDGTSVTFSDGVSYDFGTKIIKDSNGNDRMTFQELLLDADDNIKVQSAEEWKAPEFDFQVVDGQDGEKGKTGDQGIAGTEGKEGETGAAGTDGQSGDDGQAGEDGDDGDDGDDGSTGGKGRSGSSGSSGANGAKGAQGAMGNLTNADTVPQAAFTLTAFDLTAGTLEVTFEVSDEGPVLPDNAEEASGAIRLLDPQGNEIEWESTGSEALVYTDNGSLLFQDGSEYGITWKNLNPDTEYRLVVSSGYTLKNVQGKRDYINRTFYTDSTGLQLEKVYATETGFAMTLTKKDFSDATGATVQILDSKGTVLLEALLNNLSTGEIELDTSASDFDVVNGSRELTPNTTYTVQVTGRSTSSTTTSRSQIWKTLKRKPVLGKSVGYTGNRAYFDLGVESVEDLDKSIINYRYEIYEAESSTETVIKTIMSDKNSGVPLYISTSADDVPQIVRGKKYRVKVVAIYNDNEKQAEIAAEISDSFQMNETGSIAVSYTAKEGEDVNKYTSINGILTVDPKDADGLLGIGGDKGLTVMIESTGYYKKTLKFEAADLKKDANGVYNLPIELNGLRAGTTYRMSVWGYVNINPALSEEYVYTMLGDYVTSTAEYDKTYVQLSPFDSTTSAISCYLYLGKNQDPGTLTFTQKAIRAVEVKLYTGSTPQESNFVASGIVIEDKENPQLPATGKIAEEYYGSKGYVKGNILEITDKTFDLSAADLTSANYCVQVSAIYDYTKYYNYADKENLGYINEIPLTDDSVSTYALQVNKYVPQLPTPLDSAVDATPITFGQLSRYGITYTGTDADQYDDDTIVGYNLKAHFDNSGYIARTVTYYAVTEKDIMDYGKDQDAGSYTDVMLWRQAKTTRSTPWMAVTIPVQSNVSSLPGVNVMFFEPTAAATSSIEASWNERFNDTEKALNKGNGVSDNFIGAADTSTTTPTVFAPGLKRGWHYIFTYTARLDFNGDYRYPNDYTAGFQANKTLLSSGIKEVPRQGTDVKMYLDNTETVQDSSTSGIVSWKYSYTDLDGAAAVSFENIRTYDDLRSVFDAKDSSGGLTSLIDSTANTESAISNLDDEKYRTMKLKINGNTSYQFWLNQDLYDSNDLNSRDEKNAQVQSSLAESTFVVPYSSLNVEIEEGEAVGNTLPVKFIFESGNDDLKRRIVRVRIWATDKNGTRIEGSDYWYSTQFETDKDGNPYLNYDLSRAADSAGQNIKIQAEVTYDTGFGGKSFVTTTGSNDNFTVALSDGNYLDWSWKGAKLQSKKSSSAWYANYKVEKTTPTASAQYKAEEGWKITNTYSSSTYPEPTYASPVLNLRRTAKGDYDVEQSCYPVFRKTGKAQTNVIDHTVTNLKPSVTYVNWTEGITNLDITMMTNSYAMIADTEHDGTTGKYIHVVLKRMSDDKATVGATEWESYVPITDDATQSYSMTAAPLVSGAAYELSMYAVVNGETDETLLLYSGGGTSHPEAKWSPITILSSMDITNLKTFDIDYNSYKDKSLQINYGLSILSGYDLEYEIVKVNADKTETRVADHEKTMELMGYTQRDGVWGKKTGTDGFTPWKTDYQMAETISLAPGGILSPGNTYKLYVRTVSTDATRKTLAESYVQFTWGGLSKPPFYVTTSPSSGTNDGAHLMIKINPADENKVIVDGKYLVALWDSKGTCVYVSDLLDVDAGIQSLNVDNLVKGASYSLGVYGVMDMNNTGGMTAMTTKTLAEMQNLTAAEKSAMGIYTSTEKTMDSWNGRYDEIKYSFNDVGYVIVDAFNAYNINLVREIRMTVYDKKNNITKSFTKKPADSVDMFDPIDKDSTDYSTVVQTDGSYTGSSAKGSYAITCEYRGADGSLLFTVTGSATIR